MTITSKIIQFFQDNPGKEYTSQEISSCIGEKNQSVSGILFNLCKQGEVQKNQECPAKYSLVNIKSNTQPQNSNRENLIDKLREELKNLNIQEDNIKKEKNKIQTTLEVLQKF